MKIYHSGAYATAYFDQYTYGYQEKVSIGIATGSIEGKYWTFSDGTTDYYVWYEIDGNGSDPNVADKTGIKVTVLEAEPTIDQLQTYTTSALEGSAADIYATYTSGDWLLFTLNAYENVSDITAGDIGWTVHVTQQGSAQIPQTFTKLSEYNYQSNGDFGAVTFYPNISCIACGSLWGSVYGIVYSGDSDDCKFFSYMASAATVEEETATSLNMMKCKGHPITCRNYIVSEVSGVIAATDVVTAPVNYGSPNLLNSLSANDFKVLTRCTTGLSDAVNELYGQSYAEAGVGICYAHGSNSHVVLTSTTRLDFISAIGAGNNAGNQCSYGAGLEYYLNCEAYGCDVAESWTTAIIGGMIGKLLTNHPAWNFHDARQALRQSANLWATGWIADGGFGAVDYDVANAIADEDLLCMSPFYQEITVNANSVDFAWVKCPQANFNKTVIARFDSEPGRTDTPTADEIIYEGTDESFNYKYYGNAGTFWFVFYSVNDEGNYSRIESYDVSEKAINQSDYVTKLLRAKTYSKQYLDLSPTYIPFIIQCLNNGVKTNPSSINLYIYENIGTITSAFSSAFGEGFDRNLALAPKVFDSDDYRTFDDAFDLSFEFGVQQINEKTGFYGIFVPKNLLSANKQYQAYWEYEIDGKSMGKHEIFNTYNSESFYG